MTARAAMDEGYDSRVEALRPPPCNVEAEKALLGAILVNNRAYEKLSAFLKPAHFAVAEHGRIFEAVAKLIERGQIADPVTCRRYFEQDATLAEIGGPAYLMELAASASTVGNAAEYAWLVRDLALRRDLMTTGARIVAEAADPLTEMTAADLAARAGAAIDEIAEASADGTGARKVDLDTGDVVARIEARYQAGGAPVGLATGLVDLDRALGGIEPDWLVILAGRPKMGKSALAGTIAWNVARAGGNVLFQSAEMSRGQLIARALGSEANIPLTRLRSGEIADAEWDWLRRAEAAVRALPIWIDDSSAPTVAAVRARARALHRRHPLALIVVDYLQLIQPEDRYKGNKTAETTEISGGLKALAKDLRVPVLALSQLSRAVEQRDDKRPTMSDLRDSGALEQDADVVMLLYRDEYYLSQREPQQETARDYDSEHDRWTERMNRARGVAEVLIPAHRHGSPGTVKLHFDGARTRFGNLAERVT